MSYTSCYHFGFLTHYIMEKIKNSILALSFLLILSYLVGSFSQATFDIKCWDKDFREQFSIVSSLLSVLIAVGVLDFSNGSNKAE